MIFVKAVILINTEVGKEEETLDALKNIPQVKEAYIVYGIYDLVVVIEAKALDEIRDIVVNRIRRIPTVKETITMVVVKSL